MNRLISVYLRYKILEVDLGASEVGLGASEVGLGASETGPETGPETGSEISEIPRTRFIGTYTGIK